MYIHVNEFDYNKLLNGIIELGDFKDAIIDDDLIFKTLLNFQDAYKEEIKKDTLASWQRELCTLFFYCVGTEISYNYQYDDDLNAEKLIESFEAMVKECLSELEEQLEGTGSEHLWEVLERFVDHVDEHADKDDEDPMKWQYIFDGTVIKAKDFVNLLTSWLEIYAGTKLTGVNQFIYTCINANILPHELVRDINIVNMPGRKVKYGNALITFPIILLEVFDL